jgi:hypothetical protein
MFDSLSTLPWKRMGEWIHSSTIRYLGIRCRWVPESLPTVLPPEKEFPVSILYEVGWTSGPVWTQSRKEISPAPARNRTSAFQALSHCYTGWAIPSSIVVSIVSHSVGRSWDLSTGNHLSRIVSWFSSGPKKIPEYRLIILNLIHVFRVLGHSIACNPMVISPVYACQRKVQFCSLPLLAPICPYGDSRNLNNFASLFLK